jgi:hypothetical protein
MTLVIAFIEIGLWLRLRDPRYQVSQNDSRHIYKEL